jgi:hypothetical protein
MREWGIAPFFLTSVLDGGGLLGSRPGRFTSAETASGTHWIGGWLGSKFGVDAVEVACSYIDRALILKLISEN